MNGEAFADPAENGGGDGDGDAPPAPPPPPMPSKGGPVAVGRSLEVGDAAVPGARLSVQPQVLTCSWSLRADTNDRRRLHGKVGLRASAVV